MSGTGGTGELVTVVIDGAEQVSVRIGIEGEEQPATVLAADASKDLALLQVDTGGADLAALPLGDSNAVGVGDAVFAIGNPYGLDHTLTSGIVSALNRDIQAPDGTAMPCARFMSETSAEAWASVFATPQPCIVWTTGTGTPRDPAHSMPMSVGIAACAWMTSGSRPDG